MYHPDTLSAMAKQRRLQIHIKQNQLRLAREVMLNSPSDVSIIQLVTSIKQRIAAHLRLKIEVIHKLKDENSAG
jgi:hypothetical protein